MNLFKLYKASFSGLSKDVWFIALIYLVNRCGEMVIPFMSVYLTSQLGFSKTQTGMVLFSFGVGALMGSNLGGYLSDSIGNFKVMAISLFGQGIAFMGIIFFQEFHSLCLWLILTGVFSSMFSPAAFSAVNLWGRPENKTRGYSLLRMAINLGVAIGPALGGYFAYRFGYHLLFIVDGLTCFLALITLFLVLSHRKEKLTKEGQEKEIMKSPYKDSVLILFLIFNLVNMVAFFQILFSVPVYFKEVVMMDEWLIGTFFTANGLLVFFLEMPLVYKIEKTGNYFRPLIAGAILIGLGYLSLSLFPNPMVAICCYSILVALGEVINFPLIPSLAMRRSNANNQGKYMGLVSMMFAMAFLLAPISGLPIVELTGFNTYFFLAASMSLLSALFLYLMKQHFSKKG